MFEPTYALHAHIAHLTGTGLVQGQRSPDFALDVGAAVELVEKEGPSIVFLCSPNNPTGLAEDASTVSSIVAASRGLVVVDEAYGQFASWSALELVDEAVPLTVVRTYSKTWSMAGLRLGYLIGPSEVVKALERVALPYHLDALKQAAGRLALRFSAQMEHRVASVVAERDRLIATLSRMPVQVWPSQANFVLWRPLKRGGQEVWRGLVARSVLVRDTSSWPGLPGCLRTTVGTPEENNRFLSALAEVLA
jgi:histidinol-phosphate aminotransferase